MNAHFLEPYALPEALPAKTKRRIKVLSLSGGGYRGLFTAAVINALEKDLSGADKTVPFGRHFDLIAGTSIGGILAAGLSAGVSGESLQSVLEKQGPTIFPEIRFRGLRKLFGKPPLQAPSPSHRHPVTHAASRQAEPGPTSQPTIVDLG